MDLRAEVQLQAEDSWLNSERKNTVVLGTGGGKSKVAIDLLKKVDPPTVLLLTNSELLRDENWKKEFEKFEYPWAKVTSECYQTAYKWEGKHFDFVIADELDFIAEEYAKFFFNNTYDNLLGLTGFITDEKLPLIEKIAPVCFQVSTQQLQDKGMLNKSEFIFIHYPLSKAKTIQQKKKDGGMFFVSENDQYRYFDKEFQKALIVKSALEKKYNLIGVSPETQKDWVAADWKFKIMAAKRKSILNNLESSVSLVKNLVELIHRKEGNKILIFSALTKQCDKLPNPFHGKNAEDFSGLERLNSGEIKTMSVCKKLNRGANLVGVNFIVKESFDGSETDFQQTHGRLMRLDPSQTGYYIILVPYFEDMVRTENGAFRRVLLPTQVSKWAARMSSSFDMSNSRVITLGNDLKFQGDEFA